MGVTASSDDCFLGLRGLRTLATRLARHQSSALRIAEWLAARGRQAPAVWHEACVAFGDAPDLRGACKLELD